MRQNLSLGKNIKISSSLLFIIVKMIVNGVTKTLLSSQIIINYDRNARTVTNPIWEIQDIHHRPVDRFLAWGGHHFHQKLKMKLFFFR